MLDWSITRWPPSASFEKKEVVFDFRTRRGGSPTMPKKAKKDKKDKKKSKEKKPKKSKKDKGDASPRAALPRTCRWGYPRRARSQTPASLRAAVLAYLGKRYHRHRRVQRLVESEQMKTPAASRVQVPGNREDFEVGRLFERFSHTVPGHVTLEEFGGLVRTLRAPRIQPTLSAPQLANGGSRPRQRPHRTHQPWLVRRRPRIRWSRATHLRCLVP